jgi:hypothetical protein
MSTEEMVQRIANGTAIQATWVAIHFDDCYRDVRTQAAVLLEAAGMPAIGAGVDDGTGGSFFGTGWPPDCGNRGPMSSGGGAADPLQICGWLFLQPSFQESATPAPSLSTNRG